MFNSRFAVILSCVLTCLLIFGCSGGGSDPVLPENDTQPLLTRESDILESSKNFLLGYYDIYFDPDICKFEAVENRTAEFTLNIVPFLNKMPIPANGITFGSIVIHDDDPTFLGVDVEFSIHHPFPGYDQYQAYDIRGVVIGDGADVLEYGGGLQVSRHGTDLWMKNPDGYTRWFNPTDFTSELIFGYAPGGFQNLAGDAHVNPYKYYSKHLGKDDNLWSYLTEHENFDGIFESGAGRTMELEFPLPPEGLGLMFGYAVVVSWDEQGPDGPYYPVHIPEAVAVSVTQTPDVWFDGVDSGGDLILDIDLFGWEHQPSTLKIESSVTDGTAEFDATSIGTPVSEHVSTYHVEVPAGTLYTTENHEYWVIAEYAGYDYSNDAPHIPHADGSLAAFFRYDAHVADGPVTTSPNAVMVATTDTEIAAGETVSFDASGSSGSPPLTFTWDFNGDSDYSDTYTGDQVTPTHQFDDPGEFDVTVKVTNSAGEDISAPVTVTVYEPPTAIMEATTPTTIEEGETVSFDASASTGTLPLTFTWDFNGDDDYSDTYTGDPETPTKQFDTVGLYDVTVKVTNIAGEDISDIVQVNVLPYLDPDDIYVDGDYTGGDSDGTIAKPFLTIQDGMASVTSGHKVHVDYLDGGDNTYDTAGLTLKSDVTLVGDNWNNGGPGKPKMKNESGNYTIGIQYGSLSNFTLEGFEVELADQSGNHFHQGIYLYLDSGSNITIRHNNVTGSIDDTGNGFGGNSHTIECRNCDDSLVELNDIGPITWESDDPGEYARVLYGINFSDCDNMEVRNNFVHDFTIDYDGDGINWGQIRMFCVHAYNCAPISIHNNLICHIKGINDYDYRIEGMMMEGSSSGCQYQYYNNTIDNLDHSESNGGFMLRGIFIYANNATGSYINNTLCTYFYAAGSWVNNTQVYFSSPSYVYDISYSTGYSLGGISNYFHNLNEGYGCTNVPGLDPLYEDNINQPYDYHFGSGSDCEMGDPDFIDWDDTGTASGDPDEPDPENRSRMGCFGGPDGDWDPYDL